MVSLHEKLAKVEPSNAIQKLRIVYVVIILATTGIVIPLSVVITEDSKDLPNIATLIIEVAIGVIITWTVFVYSRKWDKENKIQQEKISNLVENIEKIEKEQHNTILEQENLRKKRKEWIIKQLKSMLPHFKSNLEVLEENASQYHKIRDPQHKENFESLLKAQEELNEYYNNRLRTIINQSIDVLEPETTDALERIIDGASAKVLVPTSKGIEYDLVYYQHVIKEIDLVIVNL